MKNTQIANSTIGFGRLVFSAAQLVLIAWLCDFFEIGGEAFVTVAWLTVPAFLIHAVMPIQYRLQTYLAASLIGFVLVLGIADAAWLIAVVCSFVLVCHLPLSLTLRVVILIAAAGALAYAKAAGMPVPWSQTAWPIIASILMFRLIIYLYDLHHEKERPQMTWSLSYFFLLPNVCFPLFPVVDFKKFRATFYSEAAVDVYQRGISWMFRGVYQLLLYRIVYQFFVIPPEDVASAGQLLQFMLSAYLLYLRVSGLFHLIVGMLLLFGFNLPETHKKYYLASSFNDFWRRINIFWKDFMMKIFYYPVYFKAKKLGPTPALVIATIVVFLSTWALHAYQWFWLRGTLLFEAHDLLFWAVLGGLVVVNSVIEISKSRRRIPASEGLLSMSRLANAFRVLSTFSALCILWSMWSSDSLEQWILMWQAAGAESLVILVAVPAFYLVARFCEYRAAMADSPPPKSLADKRLGSERHPMGFSAETAFSVVGIALLVAVLQIDSRSVPDTVTSFASRIQTNQLNERDAERMERGYYEHLLAVNRHSAELWGTVNEEPEDWKSLHETEVAQPHESILLVGLKPNTEIVFKGSQFRTNRWGFRDKEYAKEPDPDVSRIVFLGSSHVMGSGVRDEAVFENLLEEELNRSNVNGQPTVEVLNFAMASYSPLQHLYLLDTKAQAFAPQSVVYFQMARDENLVLRNISLALRNDVEIPFDFVREMIDRTGVSAINSDSEIRKALRPYADDILEVAERQLVNRIRETGARPICVFMPRVSVVVDGNSVAARQAAVADEGCHTIDISGAYEGYTEKDLQIAPWDSHPNELAHELLADALIEDFLELVSNRSVQSSASPRY